MADPQFFTAPDGTEMVIITRARFDALLAAEEDVDDLAAAEEGAASIAEDGGVPLEVMVAVQGGTHPIAAWRRLRGLTQAQLAEACDPPLTQAAIARLEKAEPGAGRPDTLAAIAAALDAPRWTLELRAATPRLVDRGAGVSVAKTPARKSLFEHALVTEAVWNKIRGAEAGDTDLIGKLAGAPPALLAEPGPNFHLMRVIPGAIFRAEDDVAMIFDVTDDDYDDEDEDEAARQEELLAREQRVIVAGEQAAALIKSLPATALAERATRSKSAPRKSTGKNRR
jgi:transcriptional regulator with XRE-family HTH domain